jgi:hypothetical protein
MTEKTVLMRSPEGEVQEVEATPATLVPLYSASLIIPIAATGSRPSGAAT